MSIKIFRGIGILPELVDSSTTPLLSVSTTPILGSVNTLPLANNVLERKPQQSSIGLDSVVQIPNKDLRKLTEKIPLERNRINKEDSKPQVFSGESGNVPFETIFNDFKLNVTPVYNFWTHDETTNEKDERGERKLEDLPRYIMLTWKIAPELTDPAEFLRPKIVDARPTKPVLFSREVERTRPILKGGISFVPEHLQPSGFSKIKSMLANGHLAPGVLESVVEMPLNSTGVESHRVDSQIGKENHIDEDAFLSNRSIKGISIHELKAQVNQIANGITGTPTNGDVASTSVVRPVDPNGMMKVSTDDLSATPLSYFVKTAAPSKSPVPISPVRELVETFSQPLNVAEIKNTAQTKVKFFNTSLGGLLDRNKINLITAPEHVESLAALAPYLGHLEVLSRSGIQDKARRIEPPSLPSPRMNPKEYVGYVIEKFKRQPSGVFVKVEEIDIPSREIDTYIDTKILYGEVYRYRIKSILRWVRPANVTINENDDVIEESFASHTSRLADHKASFIGSEWSSPWSYASCVDMYPPMPPDELTVRPDSTRKRITVSFKFPENPQNDISSMRLYRKVKDGNNNDVSDWVVISNDLPPRNALFIDKDVEFFQISGLKYVYAAQCVSRHGELSTLSEQISARLNEDHFSRGEYPVEFVSSPGVKVEFFGSFASIPPRFMRSELIVATPRTKSGKSSGKGVIIVSGRNTLGNIMLSQSKYVCRIQSLDTGETTDIPFEVLFKNLPARQDVSKFDFYVPQHSVSNKNSNEFEDKSDAELKKELARYQDSVLLDQEDNDTPVYNRPMVKERW